MADFIATVITLLIFLLPVAAVIALVVLIAKIAEKKASDAKETKKKEKKAEEPKKETERIEPLPRYETKTYWVVDCDVADKYVRFYKEDLEENDDYNLTAKELKEYYTDEKVYKYEPLELPLKMEGLDVYSYRDIDEWERIGRLKKTSKTDGEMVLNLYPNIYKYVTEEGVSRETDESYFGVTVTRKVDS